MTEEIKGLHVQDYKQLDVNALEEIIQLNKQLDKNLEQIKVEMNAGVRYKAISLLNELIVSNRAHTEYCIKCQGDILADMEYTAEHFEDYMNVPFPEVQTKNHFANAFGTMLTPSGTRRNTPSDYPDNDGHYSCPYDANGGDDCRNYCGLGVDE